MTATTRAPQSRPSGAPPYYPGWPTDWSITALRQPQRPVDRGVMAGPAGTASARRAAG